MILQDELGWLDSGVPDLSVAPAPALASAVIEVLVLLMALAISMGVIPVMLRLAPRLGLVDRPSARKVHAVPMARVGGWGIVLGALVPLLFWLPLTEPLVQSYLFGALVLLASGTWDDAYDIGHYAKFLGQLLAVTPVVVYGGLTVDRLPLMGPEPLPAGFSIPFTIFAMVGVINAINHSDGLDGLAGGESLLSLLAMALLAYQAQGTIAVLVAIGAVGGVLGFLRYNTYPARLFMGDSGSQFLGFTVGFMAVLLTQRVNPALSPAVPALLLGLPVADILAVLAQRIYQGMNWFKATKNHVHHRLLDLGFNHAESVVIIYSIQAGMVVSGVLLCYSWDLLILGLYAGICAVLFYALVHAKRAGWRAHRPGGRTQRLNELLESVRSRPFCKALPLTVLKLAIGAAFLVMGILVLEVPRDFGLMSLVLLAVLGLELVFRRSPSTIMTRAVVYALTVFLVFLSVEYPSPLMAGPGGWELAYYGLVAMAVAVWVRCGADEAFRVTPLDYLTIFVVVAVGVFSRGTDQASVVSHIVVRTVVLLYACEVILFSARTRWNTLNLSAFAGLAVLGARGMLL